MKQPFVRAWTSPGRHRSDRRPDYSPQADQETGIWQGQVRSAPSAGPPCCVANLRPNRADDVSSVKRKRRTATKRIVAVPTVRRVAIFAKLCQGKLMRLLCPRSPPKRFLITQSAGEPNLGAKNVGTPARESGAHNPPDCVSQPGRVPYRSSPVAIRT